MSEILKVILKSFLPGFLVFIGGSDIFFNFLCRHEFLIKNDTNIEGPKIVCFILGLFWTGLVMPVQYEVLKKSKESQNNKLSIFFGHFKDIYIKSVKDKLNISSSLSTRVFIRRRNFLGKWKFFSESEIYFDLKEIKGISDPISASKLWFRVHPKPEGLLGRSFSENKVLIDLNVDPDRYNLSRYQRSITSKIKFCCVAPIYDESNNIIAMISLDSEHTIKITEDSLTLWTDLVQEYCIILDKFINNK